MPRERDAKRYSGFIAEGLVLFLTVDPDGDGRDQTQEHAQTATPVFMPDTV